MQLLTCSNSGPDVTSARSSAVHAPAAPGGLVPILAELVQETGGRWIFSAPARREEMQEGGDYVSETGFTWQALPIAQDLIDRQREAISIRTLLWLFHYLFDTSVEPAFGTEIRAAWEAYREVNQRFAGALAAAHKNSTDEIVLVNDFHLMLAPALFAAQVPQRAGRLAYFHHVPWCEPDYFGVLPPWMRTEVLESLLCCDVAGFHSARWGNAFLACCDRFLPAARVCGRTVTYLGHETTVTTAPGPIDARVLEELKAHSGTESRRSDLAGRAAGRRVITRVDRLDLWKNLVRGFSAYEMLLRRRPQLAGELWFCAIVSPARLQTDRHRRYQGLCEDIVRRINDRFTTAGEAATLLYPDEGGNQRNRAVAALELASVTLVNSTYDGLNMVAKEAVIVNPDAPLLLSANTGVYPTLQPVATAIQPFDIVSTADALERAIAGDRGTRGNDVDACLASLRDESAAAWLRAVLGEPEDGGT